MSFFKSAHNKFLTFSRWALYMGAVFLALMVLISTIDVVGRYIFNSPLRGSLEMIEYLMVGTGTLGLGWATLKNVHISVDILVQNFKQGVRICFDIVTLIMCLVIFGIISWQTVLEAFNSMLVYEDASEILKIPTYPFYFFLALGFIILCLAIVFNIIILIGKLVKK